MASVFCLVLSKCQDPYFDFGIMQKINFRSCNYISVHRLSVLTFEIAEEALVLHEKISWIAPFKKTDQKTLTKYLVSQDFCHACFSDCLLFHVIIY